MPGHFAVLYVGENAEARATRLEASAPLSVDYVSDVERVLDALAEGEPDCIVSEQSQAQRTGLDVLERIRDTDPRIPFLLVVEDGDETLASEAISAGVTDYFMRTGDDEADADRIADVAHRTASRYRAEQDVAMLNDLARNVYERVTDAFFAVDRNWRFTYVNEQAEDQLGLDRGAIVGECIWELFPDVVGTTFHTEATRAMATQEPVTFSEYFPPTDQSLRVRAFPSETGLSMHFRRVPEDEPAGDEEHLRELTSLLSQDLLDAIEDVRSDVETAKENASRSTDELRSALEALDRMTELVNHSMRLANEP